jgi:hypothetical protein
MREYSYSPKSKKNNITAVAGVCFFTAAVLYGLICTFDFAFEGVVGIVAVVLFVASMLLLTRYVFRTQVYRVVERDVGSFDLVIDEITGKNKVSVCRVALANIEKVEIRDEKNAAELKKEARGRKIFSYLPDLFPVGECWVFVTECGEELVIKLYADETLLSMLKAGERTEEISEE